MKLHIFALAAHGIGISGGDRIFMELARRWSKKFIIDLYLCKEGFAMCERNGLKAKGSKLKFVVSKMNPWYKFGFFINYFARILEGIKLGLTLDLSTDHDLPTTFLYSASDFWMDVFPCVLLKIRHSKIKWIAGWYQTAPNPLMGYQGGRYKLSALFYFLSQLPVKPFVSHFADFVFVNNENERKQFNRLNKKGKVFVFIGAVDLKRVKEWKSKQSLPLRGKRVKVKKIYDAVFQGRFHPQKGVVELIDVWKRVVEKRPDALLAMIGDGPLMEKVKLQIANYKLQKNIKLFSYLFDGDQKYKIFSQSKIVVHPAFYDSGGMAAAEAMAFGLPCVGFNLPSYKSYYPKGMVKVKVGDLNVFSKTILLLLKNRIYRSKIAKGAVLMIEKSWSWDIRADQVLRFVNK